MIFTKVHVYVKSSKCKVLGYLYLLELDVAGTARGKVVESR